MIAKTMSDALKPQGYVDTYALASGCMTDNPYRDVQMAKNILVAMRIIDQTHGGHELAFMRHLSEVGFYFKYSEMMLGFSKTPKYACWGVEIVSR